MQRYFRRKALLAKFDSFRITVSFSFSLVIRVIRLNIYNHNGLSYNTNKRFIWVDFGKGLL